MSVHMRCRSCWKNKNKKVLDSVTGTEFSIWEKKETTGFHTRSFFLFFVLEIVFAVIDEK